MGIFRDIPNDVLAEEQRRISADDWASAERRRVAAEWAQEQRRQLDLMLPQGQPRGPEIGASGFGAETARYSPDAPSPVQPIGGKQSPVNPVLSALTDIPTGLDQFGNQLALGGQGQLKVNPATGRLENTQPGISTDWTELIARGTQAREAGEPQLPLGTALTMLGPSEVGAIWRAGRAAIRGIPAEAKAAAGVVGEGVRAANRAITAPKTQAALERVTPGLGVKAVGDYDGLFAKAGDTVDGRVVRGTIPNMSSIEASITQPRILTGVREVPISAFEDAGPPRFYSVSEERRTSELAERIRESGEINPLIVAYDAEGPYILEGGHRFDALKLLGAKSFPALVVIDEPALQTAKKGISATGLGEVSESLPKIKNAISGTVGGTPPEVGGAVLGGVIYQDDPNLTPQENAQRRLAATATGALAGRMARRGRSPGATVEDVTQSSNAANRALGEMYAKAPKEGGASPWGALERGRRAVVRAFTDEGVDLNKFQQESAKAKGAALTMGEMAAELRRLNPDKAAQVHLQEQLAPAIQAVGKDRLWLSVYLTHQDNIDVAKAMGNESRKFSGGLKASDSEQALIDMANELGDERMQPIRESAEQILAFNRQLLARKREAGLISQELHDALIKEYPHYVPTRITDYLKDPLNIPRGNSLSVRDTGLRRNTVEGTFREREDPLASVVRNAYETEALARKNQAFNAFLKLREMNPEAQSLIRPVADSYTATRLEAKVTGFVDGKRGTYVVPKALEYIIKTEPNSVLPGFAGAMWGGMMNLFRAGATSRNPIFLAGNAFLDAGAYAIRESSRAGGPQHLPKVLLELGKAYGDAFGGVLQGTYKGSTAEFLKGGGGIFGFFQGTPKSTRATVENLGRANVFTVQKAGDIRRLTTDLLTLKPVESIGERIELAPRVAAFRLAQKRGANNVQAVINGRTVTIDFAQGGTVAKVINQFVPFFNVGVQASTIPYRSLRENPKTFLATAAALLSGPTIASEAWNRADPQRAKDYEDVPQYIKDQGIVIMLPVEAPVDKQGNRDPQFVHLRMREFAPFVTLTREAVQRALGDDPREWRDLIAGTLGSASPIQGNTPADVLSSFTPLGVSTGLQLASNQDYFRGRMIATKRNDERASALSKAVAKALGPQPSQAEFAIRDLATGVGGAALAASDLAAGISKGQSPQDMPGVGGAYGRFVKGSTGGRMEKARRELITPASSEALKAAGVELNLSPVGYTIDNVPLKLVEEEHYQVLVNKYTEQAIQKALALRNWGKYDPAQRTEVVRDLIDWARDKAKAEMLKEIGSAEIKRRLAAGAS